MKCDFCNDIINLQDQIQTKNWDRQSRLIYDPEDKHYDYWFECDDSYYSGIIMQDLQYCPFCGKKL